jgi:hypothetical protein
MANFGLGFAFGAVDDGLTKMQDKVTKGFDALGDTITSIGQHASASARTMSTLVATKAVSAASRAYTGLSTAVGTVDRSMSAAVGKVKGLGLGLRDYVVANSKQAAVSIKGVADSLKTDLGMGIDASLANLKRLARLTGAPAFPVIPQLLLPGGFLPLPVKYRLRFGEPMHFTGDPDDEDAVIEEKVWAVRAAVQSMVNRGLKERRGIFR